MIGTCCAKYFSNCIFENTKNNLQQKKKTDEMLRQMLIRLALRFECN